MVVTSAAHFVPGVERVVRLAKALQSSGRAIDAAALAGHRERFEAALADDLDTPTALTALGAAAQLVLASPAGRDRAGGPTVLRAMATRLGLALPQAAG